jgi:LmbE family N-acetylglucosaminyl deacetylase
LTLAQRLGHRGEGPLRLLCLGAHADDIEIGCGGTLLRLLGEDVPVDVRWEVFSAAAERTAEAERSAARILRDSRERTILVHDLADGRFPLELAGIKDRLEIASRTFAPHLVFTHARNDAHQDHRTLAEATYQTFRGQAVLEYEIPKYDPDLGAPNLFVALDTALARDKIAHLLDAFASQRSRRWFTADLFHALLRLRGVQSGAASGLAEAFYCPRLVL